MTKDFYETLDIKKGATETEIKKAYRTAAKKHHPDRGGNETEFKKVQEAYDTLGNSQKRQQYDQFGSAGSQSGGFGGFGGQQSGGFDFNGANFDMGDMGDIFSNFFGGGQRSHRQKQEKRGRDLEVNIEITFREAAFGIEKTIAMQKQVKCDDCKGKGGDGTTCAECHGTGHITRIQQTILGAVQTQTPCPRCHGEGKIIKNPCKKCSGHGRKREKTEIKIKIPAGIDDGNTLRMRGHGETGERGSPSGDLYLNIRVATHPHGWWRENLDIHSKLTLNLADAVLGTDIQIDTLHGKREIPIKSGTPHGKKLQLSHDGIHASNGQKGNHILHIELAVPTKLTRHEKQLWEELQNT